MLVDIPMILPPNMENSQSQESGIKIGFTFQKTVAPTVKKKREQEVESRDYVTELSGNKLISLYSNTKEGPLVIPLEIQGQTKRSKRYNPATDKLDPHPATTTNTIESSSSGTQAFLNTSTAATNQEKSLEQLAAEEIVREVSQLAKAVGSEAKGLVLPMILQNQIDGIENITDEDERFKYDLASRPEEANAEAYEEVPIEEFGVAMLRGMGWEPGKAIGLNNRGLTEPIEYVRRPGYRLGLGATPKDVEIKKKKYIKPGESREPPPQMALPVGPDGRVRHVKGISEKLVPLKNGLSAGQLVGIVSGPHDGLYARVVQLIDEDVLVRLEASSEEVLIPKSELIVVDTSKLSENHPALKFMKALKESADNDRDDSKDDKPSWIRPHIVVRMVSKSFANGKYYNKKVRILDMVGRDECVVQLESGSLVEGVKQRMLETVIPNAGGKVIVVEGVHKGRLGILVERKRNKPDQEEAVVQLLGDLTIGSYSLDDVAQYAGSVDEEATDMEAAAL